MSEVEFRALGPLSVLVGGSPVELGKGNERALLALLVLHAGQPLSGDSIIDALWGERPPPTAREMVRNYVARVRKRLGEDAIETLPVGYRLNAAPETVDWLRFERLAGEGARALEVAEAQKAFTSLEEALALWRGRPLPELDFSPSADREIGRLEELRLRAIEDRVDAELALGRSSTLVAELEQLGREHPYSERLLGQLMLALYRSGRQKDALERYQTGRRLLVEEAGLEPGPQLQQLHVSILRHDPGLQVPARGAQTARASGARSPKRRRIGLLAAGAVIAAVAITVPLVVLGRSPNPVRLTGRSLAVLDPRSGAPVGSLSLDSSPGPLAVSHDTVWVGTPTTSSVVAVAPRTLRATRRIATTAFPYSVAAGNGAAWVGNGFDGTLTRIDREGNPTPPFRPQPRARGRLPLAYGLRSLWVGSQDNTLTRLDPRSDRAVAVIHGVTEPQAVAVGAGSVWIAEGSRDGVLHVDPGTKRVVGETPIGGRGFAIAVGDGAVWVVTPAEGHLWRIDPRNGALTASIDVGDQPSFVVTTSDAVWTASRQGILTEIDPRTSRVTRTIALNRSVDGLASGNGRLWVTLR